MTIISRLTDFTGEDVWDGIHEVIECKRALSPSGLPGIDYALNPYGGCEHGCLYCYAPELTHSDWNTWRVVKVKMNIASRLAKEIPNVKGVIGIGTTTDPYQQAESRFMLTRTCLGKLKERDMRVHIHTKSDLILRDTDILKKMSGDIGITITSMNDRISKRIEPGAPMPEVRLNTLKELTSEGLDTYALVGPVLDILDGMEPEFAEAVASTGVKRMYLDNLNRRPQLSERMQRIGIGGSDAVLERIRSSALSEGIEVFDVF